MNDKLLTQIGNLTGQSYLYELARDSMKSKTSYETRKQYYLDEGFPAEVAEEFASAEELPHAEQDQDS